MEIKRNKFVTALIILNYNNYEDTINCIESVERYNTSPIKIVIVDNGSSRRNAASTLGKHLAEKYVGRYRHFTDEELAEAQKVKQTLPYMTFIESKSNDGYARGNNKALYLTQCDEELDYVMILNNDVLFVQDIIPGLIDKYEHLKDVAIISPLLYKKDFEGIDYNCARLDTSFTIELTNNFFYYIFRAFGRFNPLNERRYLIKNANCLPELMKIELPSGSCMLIRKNLFEKIGFFDPHTFLYYEENILFKKVVREGLQNYIITNLKCIHLGATSISKTPGYFATRCYLRSCRYYMKNYVRLSSLKYSLLVASQVFRYCTFVLQKKLFSVLGKENN